QRGWLPAPRLRARGKVWAGCSTDRQSPRVEVDSGSQRYLLSARKAGSSHEYSRWLIWGNCEARKVNSGKAMNEVARIQKSLPSSPGLVLVRLLSVASR